jgi:uncharacterized protein
VKIIALPDLHEGAILIDLIAEPLAGADLVLLVGDLTNSGRASAAAEVVNAVQKYNRRILAVPGNWDRKDVGSFLTQEAINIHRRSEIREGMAFIGVGGSLIHFGLSATEYTEAQLKEFLAEAVSNLPPELPKILVSHQPPAGTLNEVARNGTRLGSKSVRAFIEQYQPLICFTGHIHEGQGIDTIGRTKVVNPGPLWEGAYAYAEVNGDIEALEIRKIAPPKN